MEANITSQLVRSYTGNLVLSNSKRIEQSKIYVEPLNKLLVKVSFEVEGEEFMFRAMLSEQEEGLLMIIQDRVTQDYIISGVSGFLHKKPNIHGGFLKHKNSFYFHINLEDYKNSNKEIFFMGKPVGEKLS